MKPTLLYPLLSLLVVLFSTVLRGQSALTLEQALAQALQGNHAYQARLRMADVQRGWLEQAGKRANPELEPGVENSGKDYRVSLFLVQPWERGGKRALRVRVAEGDVDQALLAAEDHLRLLSSEVKVAFIDLARLQRQASVLEQHLERIARIVKLDEVRVREGEIPSLNLDHLRIEQARWTMRNTGLEIQRQAIENHLSGLIGAPHGTKYSLQDSGSLAIELPPMEQAVAQALEQRPDLKRLRAAVAQAEHTIGLEQARARSDWKVGLGYIHERFSIGADAIVPGGIIESIGDRDHGFEVKLSIPLTVRDNNSGNIAAAVALKRVREAEVAQAESEVRAQISTLYERFRLHEKLHEAYGKNMLPLLTEDLRREEEAYVLSGGSLGEWLRDQESLSEGALEQVESEFWLKKSVVELEREVGAAFR